MVRSDRNGPDWKRINARRRAVPATSISPGPRAGRADDHIFFTDDDRAVIFCPFLDHAFLIYEHHKSRDEYIVALAGGRCRKDCLFETTVFRKDHHGHRGYLVKLRVSDEGVYEYGREERL